MSVYLFAMTISKPYLDYISNQSDWVSRLGYVLVSLIGLLVALEVPGNNALGGGVLLTVNILV